MRKKGIFLVLLLTAAMAMGQRITLSQGTDPNKVSKMVPVGAGDVIGKIGDDYGVLLPPQSDIMRFCLVDQDMNIKKSVSLPRLKNASLLFSCRDGNKLALFLQSYTAKAATVMRFNINLSAMKMDGKPQVILDKEVGRKGSVDLYAGASPSGNFRGLVALAYDANTDRMSAEAFLYDDKAQQQWRQPFEARPITNIVVTDEGEIVSGGCFGTGYQSAAYFMDIAEGDVRSYHCALPHTPYDFVLLNSIDGKAVAVSVNIDPDDKKQEKVASCTALAYDLYEETLIDTSTYYFTNEDKQVMHGEKATKENKDNSLEKIMLQNYCATNYGGAAELMTKWMVHVVNNSTHASTDEYHEAGVLLLAADTNGEFVWHRPVRHSSFTMDAGGLLLGSYLVSDGENVCFITNENKDCDTACQTDERVKPMTSDMFSRECALTGYLVDEAGNVKKQVLAVNKQSHLGLKVFPDFKGGYHFISANMMRAVVNTIRFE